MITPFGGSKNKYAPYLFVHCRRTEQSHVERFLEGTPRGSGTYSLSTTPTDSYFDNVILLAHMDDSVSWTDSSNNVRLLSPQNGASILSSGYFDSGLNCNPGLERFVVVLFGTTNSTLTADFTMEAMVNTGSVVRAHVVGHSPSQNDARSCHLYIRNGRCVFRVFAASTYGDTEYTGSLTISASNWYHLAVSRNSGIVRTFVNGYLDLSITESNVFSETLNRFQIGGWRQSFTNEHIVDGYVDEVRITRGVGRYTSNFSIPTTKHPNTGP